VNLAAISYDAVETLKRFAAANHISYPLLSDTGSAVIKAFGLLNTNMPPSVFAYGVPFPGQFLLSPDGIVREKFFLPNYRLRTAGSAVLMELTGEGAAGNTTVLATQPLRARIELSAGSAFTGQQLAFSLAFSVGEGWHIYGAPLPESYTPLSMRLDDEVVAQWSLDLPAPVPMRFAELNETLPVYRGEFRGRGKLLIKSQLEPGEYHLRGTLSFQACHATICEPPRTLAWELPVKVLPAVPAPPKPAS